MKKLMLAPILSLCLIKGYGQDTESPLSRTIFKLSPQHFIDNSLKAGVERFRANYGASMTFFVTGTMEKDANVYYGGGYNGVAGELQLRKYMSPMKAVTSKHNKVFYQGIYGAAYLQSGYYTGGFKGESGHYDPVSGVYTSVPYNYQRNIVNGGFGFTIGYQKTLWQTIFLEAFIGGGIQFASSRFTGITTDQVYDDYQGISDPAYKGILPKIGLNIGIGL